MKHIVVGGSGFTGSELSRQLLEQKQQVHIVDIRPPSPDILARGAIYQPVDITQALSVEQIPFEKEDIVYHLAARQFHDAVPKRDRLAWFAAVNCNGTQNILEKMEAHGCHSLIYLSTDMVYGLPQTIPVPPDHTQNPLGAYGESKKRSEELCRVYRQRGFHITILRPRLIIGPGRLGILKKLFWLIRNHLPVPLIGNGANAYQMVSVFDVVQAIHQAREKEFPDRAFNLGSVAPPSVRRLLRDLIHYAGSQSILVPTPGWAIKKILAGLDAAGIPLMYGEQYGIADINYLVDISDSIAGLDWNPRYGDDEMIRQAYDNWRMTVTGPRREL